MLERRGADVLLDLAGRRHVWIEDFTLQNARALISAHGTHDLVIRGNRFQIWSLDITARSRDADIERPAPRDFIITDNVFSGYAYWLLPEQWQNIYGVNVTGTGHIIAYNHFSWAAGWGPQWRSRVAVVDRHSQQQRRILHGRRHRSRLLHDECPSLSQPDHQHLCRDQWPTGVGGPVYVFRNVISNVEYSPFKLHNDTSGMLIFHNTSVKLGVPFAILPARESVTNVITRNNLFVGTSSPALRSTGRTIRCDFDNDGYSWPSGPFAEWNSVIYGLPRLARMSGQLYATQGAVTIEDPERLFVGGLRPPEDVMAPFDPSRNAPVLRTSSEAADRGTRLANFNNHYQGAGPDLGCCEAKEPLPHFGPRDSAPAAIGSNR